MKLPQLTKGRRVTAILQEMANYMRAATVTNVIGGKLRQSTSGITIEIDRPKPGKGGGGASDRISWRLSVALDGEDWKWQVSSQRSTVQDGTNGPILDLDDPTPIFDEPATIDATRYVALKATVGAGLALTDWVFELYEDRPDEILIEEDGDDVLRQTELRFLIGKITIEGDPETATVEQIASLPQRIVTVFLNGKICKGITSV